MEIWTRAFLLSTGEHSTFGSLGTPAIVALLLFASSTAVALRVEDRTPTCETRAWVENLRDRPNAPSAPEKNLPAACLQVLKARRAIAENSHAEAVRLLQQAKAELPAIAAHLDLLTAETWVRANDRERARKILRNLEKTQPDFREHPQVHALWTEIYRAEKNAKETIRRLRQQLKHRNADEASTRHELGLLLSEQGKHEAAQRELRELYIRFPAHPGTLDLLTKMSAAPRELSVANLRKRIGGLMLAARYIDAAREAEALLASKTGLKPADVDALEKFAVEGRVRAGQTELALERVRTFPIPSSDARQRLRAWTLGKAGLANDASRAWHALYLQSQDRAVRAEACFFSAFALYENASLQEADRSFRACAPALEGSTWEVAGLWYQALGAILLDQRAAALDYLNRLVTDHRRHREYDKHQYWYARILREGPDATANEKAKGDKILRRLATKNITTYYGMLARQRLGLPNVAGTRVPPDALAQSVTPGPRVSQLRLLYELGFDEEVARQIQSVGRGRADLGLAHLVEHAHKPWRTGSRLIPRPPTRDGHLKNDAGWRASYAMPYRKLVSAHCAQNDISEAFAYAIMRTESGFSPRAKSPVGALGLLQLMPYTARGMATVLKRPTPLSEELYRPETNIALGVAFLGLAKHEFGHAAWAAAVYNGGPDNVARWMNKFGHLEAELFIERIPFRETRNYVKRVSETMALYRALVGDELRVELPSRSPGPAPESFTWFPPSERSVPPVNGADAPGGK